MFANLKLHRVKEGAAAVKGWRSRRQWQLQINLRVLSTTSSSLKFELESTYTKPIKLNSRKFQYHKRCLSTLPSDSKDEGKETAPSKHTYDGPIDKLLRKLKSSPDDLIRGPEFNRWKIVPAATLTHVCLGSIFAWSVFSQPLMRSYGVVVPAASDWVLGDITLTFSLIMGGFAWGAIFSKYLDRFGPRMCGLIGAASLGSGFTLVSIAVQQNSLPLLYTGGLIWGLSNGWAYVPPVASLIKWFPDRKGFASGLCILGYGGGAMLAAPLFSGLMKHYKTLPDYLGPEHSCDLINEGGKLYARVGDTLSEVVVATPQDIIRSGFEGIGDAGVYVVGTGATGVTEAFGMLGVGYGLAMAACSMFFRLPVEGYVPPGSVAEPEKSETADLKDISSNTTRNLTLHNVDTDAATRTPQFWLMYSAFGLSIAGAYGFLSCGKVILSETFSSLDMVTPVFTTAFVAGMSGANMTGRIAYTNLSDFLAHKLGGDPFYGRRMAYSIMFGAAAPAYLGVVWSVHQNDGVNTIPLMVFSSSVGLILSSFGGTAATRPALVGDVFGLRNVAPLSARQLSVVLPASFIGPKIVTYFREQSTHDGIRELTQKVDNDSFITAFGLGKEHLETLMEQKTITVSRLMELVPPGTTDPSPYVYDTSMYLLSGLGLLALGTNMMVKPVSKDLHMKD